MREMQRLDKETREAIREAVKAALMEREMRDGKVFLTARQVCEQFGMFSPDWIKREGWRLPRRRVSFMGDDGQMHSTQWGYDLQGIQEIVRNGVIPE